MTSPSLRIAAIVTESGPNALLAQFARDLAARGVRVRGLLQQYAPDMQLVDVDSGQAYAITQSLGEGSEACTIDPSGFAEASVVLRAALAEPAQLVIVNRFGKLEAAGGGLSAEMLALMAEGVPVLTSVGPDYLESWTAFTGGIATLLPAEKAALQAWADTLLMV